jgi:hypothetical protein
MIGEISYRLVPQPFHGIFFLLLPSKERKKEKSPLDEIC